MTINAFDPEREFRKKGPKAIAPVQTERDGTRAGLPRSQKVRIIAQDPTVRDSNGSILTADVSVPTDVIGPGPRTHRFHVVDFDSSHRAARQQVDFRSKGSDGSPDNWTFSDGFASAPDDVLIADPDFRAQNSYAIAARTLATFETALGRRVPWSFDSHELYIVPSAFEAANAYYSPQNHALLFGYFDDLTGGIVRASLSHDIVAHETTHAILDGLRSRFLLPGVPDQLAFHEGFADVVALLSVFSLSEVVKQCLLEAGVRGGERDIVEVFQTKVAKSSLFGLAEEFGQRMNDGHRDALRVSLSLDPASIPEDWRDGLGVWAEPHRRGEMIVAAVLHSFLDIWQKRLGNLADDPGLNLIVDQGVKSAQHMLTMVIRALDYCPPVELEFDDFLDSILVSDSVVAPNDEHDYRTSLREQFGRYKIVQPPYRTENLYEKSPVYSTVNFGEFLIHADEVYRFIWQNAEKLGIEARDYYTRVCDVQPSIRVGPDGFIVHETIACYVQSIEGNVGDLMKHSYKHDELHGPGDKKRNQELRENGEEPLQPREPLVKPDEMSDDAQVQLWGGGVLIFDQFGRPKYHQRKDLCEWKRQNARLRRLFANRETDSRGRYGFADADSRNRFRFHQPGQRQRRPEW